LGSEGLAAPHVTPGAGGPLTVAYDRVSLAVWTLVSVRTLVAGAVLGVGVSSLGQRTGGVVTCAIAGSIGWYLVSRVVSSRPRLEIGTTGISDWRSGREVFLPWSSIQRVRFTPGRGRKRIALTIREGAPVEGRWPWWMSGWAKDKQDIVLSDWLVAASLDDIAAIRRFIPDVSLFEPEPTIRNTVEEFRSWRDQRRRER
jgi:hypothetical protein